jgi:hypothetical protein
LRFDEAQSKRELNPIPLAGKGKAVKTDVGRGFRAPDSRVLFDPGISMTPRIKKLFVEFFISFSEEYGSYLQ